MKRRTFIQVGAAGLVARRAVYGFPANEAINVAGLGVGGRFHHLMKAFVKIPGLRLAGVCDVSDARLEAARKLTPEAVPAVKDHRELLERKDIDAVLIASPDHWHVPMTVDACAAGKDVYVEKPLTHDLSEGSAVIEAQNRHRRIVQVGMQQRSMPHLIKARELIAAGRLGKIVKAHLTWNRNAQRGRTAKQGIDPASVDWQRFCGSAPPQPFDEYRLLQWRWFWDFGGGLFTDLMVHWLDVVHWMCGLDHPAQAVALGDHFLFGDLWQTPDTVQAVMRYPQQGMQVYFEGTFANARNAAMTEIMGSEATLYFDRGRFELLPEPGRTGGEQLVLGDGPRGADFYDKPEAELLHLTNWGESMRTRKPPVAPAEAGVSAAGGAHLCNLALRGSGTAEWPMASSIPS